MNILRVVVVVVVVAGSANDTVALCGGLLIREYCNRSWIGTLSVDVSMVVVVYDSLGVGAPVGKNQSTEAEDKVCFLSSVTSV
jgi:hypothetical protein